MISYIINYFFQKLIYRNLNYKQFFMDLKPIGFGYLTFSMDNLDINKLTSILVLYIKYSNRFGNITFNLPWKSKSGLIVPG